MYLTEKEGEIIKGKVNTIRKWMSILEVSKSKFCGLILALTVSTLLTSCSPLLFGHLIDLLGNPKSAFAFVGVIAIVAILGNVANFAAQRLQFMLITDVEANAKRKLFREILHIPYESYATIEKGKFVNTLQRDAEVFSKILTLVVSLGVNIISTLWIALIMIRINWKMTALILIAFPLNLMIFKRYGVKIKEKTEEGKRMNDKYQTFLNEVLVNMKTIKNFYASHFSERIFNKSVRKTYDVLNERNHYNRKGSLIIQLLNSCVDVIVVVLGITQIGRGLLTIGGLVSFQTYSSTLNKYLLNLSVVNADIQEIKVSLNRINVILDGTQDYVKATKTEVNKECFDQDIVLRNVSFAYDCNTPIFENVNLKLEQNKIISIMGQNGSGKSTLLNLLSLMYTNYQGDIILGNVQLRDIPECVLRENICFVFQQASLFTLSLRENFLLGNEDATDQEIEAACKKVMLWQFVSSLPDGLDTMIGDNGITLSEGQKQKVVIARALLRHAKIYLLDEITANLDIESELQICALLKELKKDGLVINISHRKKILEISDISYELVDGKFIRTSN